MRISDWSSDVCSSDLDPEHEIGRMRSPRLTVSDLCSVHVSQQIFGQMRAGIPTQLKVFDCEPAAKRREQLSLVCALDSGHNQVRFGKISPGRLQMTAVKCTNLRDRFSLRQKLRDVRNFHLGTAGVR